MFSVNNYHTRENQLSSICNCKVEANINFCFCLLPERKLLPASPQGISPDATFLSQIKKLQFWSRKEVSECTLQSKSSLSALKVILEAVQAPQNFSPALLWALGYTMPKYLFLFYLTSKALVKTRHKLTDSVKGPREGTWPPNQPPALFWKAEIQWKNTNISPRCSECTV